MFSQPCPRGLLHQNGISQLGLLEALHTGSAGYATAQLALVDEPFSGDEGTDWDSLHEASFVGYSRVSLSSTFSTLYIPDIGTQPPSGLACEDAVFTAGVLVGPVTIYGVFLDWINVAQHGRMNASAFLIPIILTAPGDAIRVVEPTVTFRTALIAGLVTKTP